MNKALAKLVALKGRVESLLRIYSTVPEHTFNDLRDDFYKIIQELKGVFTDLEDFKPQNYNAHKGLGNAYFSWAVKELIADIEYFQTYLNNIEIIQIPNLEVSEEGIYFSGQHFDALLKFNKIISNAKKEIILIDNYLNENILELLASKNTVVDCKVLTLSKSYSPAIQTFVMAFNKQYKNLEVKTTNAFHDRFIIIDKKDFYHFGASIKDAGNKGFMFSKIEQDFLQSSLLKKFSEEWK